MENESLRNDLLKKEYLDSTKTPTKTAQRFLARGFASINGTIRKYWRDGVLIGGTLASGILGKEILTKTPDVFDKAQRSISLSQDPLNFHSLFSDVAAGLTLITGFSLMALPAIGLFKHLHEKATKNRLLR